MAGESFNTDYAGIPQEWVDANPTVPPSTLAKAYGQWLLTQPDAMGRFKAKLTKEPPAGTNTMFGETDMPGRVVRSVGQMMLPNTNGEAVSDVMLSGLPMVGPAASKTARVLQHPARALAAETTGLGVDYASGHDLRQSLKDHAIRAGSATALGLLGEAGNTVAQNILQRGVNESDAGNVARSLDPIFTTDLTQGAQKGLYDQVVGGGARSQQKRVLDFLEGVYKSDLGGGSNLLIGPGGITVADFKKMVSMASPKGEIPVRTMTMPTGTGNPASQVPVIAVDDAFEVLRRLKSMERAALKGDNPMSKARAMDAGSMAERLEQAIVSHMSPQGEATYSAFKSYAKDSDAIISFLEKNASAKNGTGIFKEGPRGPEFDVTALQSAIREMKSGRKGSPMLKSLQDLGFDDFVAAITRGAGSGAGDVLHGPLHLFGLGYGTLPGRFGGMNVPGTTLREFAGGSRRPISPSVTQPVGAQLPQTIKTIGEMMQ